MAFAGAVNLRIADLPGFRVKRKDGRVHVEHNPSPDGEGTLRHCIHFGKEPRPSLKSKSPNLTAGHGFDTQAFSSKVEIEPNAAAAHKGFEEASRLLADPNAGRCITRFIDSLRFRATTDVHTRFGLATVRLKLGNLRLAPIPMPSDTQDAVGMTLAMSIPYTVTLRGRTSTPPPVTYQMDMFAFRVGRASVTLTATGFGRACSPDLEAQLFYLLRSRANGAASIYRAVQAPSSAAAAS